MNSFKKVVKSLLPLAVIGWYRRRVLQRRREVNQMMSTKEVFTKIYSTNEWGGEEGTFCSGSGSRLEVAHKYCEMVKSFVVEHRVKTILDLGCGDFTVGRNIQTPGVKYIGIDIVQSLIDRNRKEFGASGIVFECMDIIEDTLPDADLVLVRQVLQHLSNDQILKVLNKLEKYSFVLVTEHYPAAGSPVVPNIDKPHGGDTRLVDNSAVYLDLPPFNLQGLRLVLDVNALDGTEGDGEGERIKTVLLSHSK